MSFRLTLIHGWGYDADMWTALRALLPEFDIECIDLGFFGAPTVITPSPQPRLVVAHSLGLLWWLAQARQDWVRLVALNAFPRFVAAEDFPQGVAPRVLARMQKRFTAAPAQVLSDFQTRCGRPGPALPSDTQPLAIGLHWLATLDARSALQGREQDVWALAADDDGIVPAALSRAAYAALPDRHLQWVQSASHLLPLTAPERCAELIREAAR